VTGKAVCLICNESFPSIFKEYNIVMHYNSKHKDMYKNCVGALQEIVAALKRGLVSYKNVVRKQYNDSSSVLQASSLDNLRE
jgi:hypothetical protein